MIRSRSSSAAFLTMAAALLIGSDAIAAIINVDHADDVCAPTADPCVITTTIETVPGALLDFGLRRVELRNGGNIDAGTGDLQLLGGDLSLDRSGNVIQLKGTTASGDTSGGFVRLRARRGCSGNASLPCIRNSECAAASAGTCSVGNGDVVIDGKVLGSADSPGAFIVTAAGDIDVLKTITINGLNIDADGGTVELDARGDVSIDARIQLTSGSDSTGGELCAFAGGDITTTDLLDVTGGDFDGGLVELFAGGTITITDEIRANATTGEGFGGEIALQSDGDIVIIGGGPANRLQLITDGHQSSENFGGDGGSQDYFAGGDVHIGRFVKASSDGAAPDGSGDSIAVEADGDLLLEGELQAKGTGLDGSGGEIDISASGTLTVASDAILDVTAPGSGGDVIVTSLGDVVMAGTVQVAGGAQGASGSVDLDASDTLTMSGRVDAGGGGGGAAGLVTLFGCWIDVLSSAAIDNKPDGATNRFTVREQLTVSSGADVSTGTGGANVVLYRTSAKPPILSGAFSPAPQLQLTPALTPCPICGNSVIEPGESCDDGNTFPGDGCNSQCQDEGCIADTPGYPLVPLCDDGDDCTQDTCNSSISACEHSASCDDGVECTIDSCVGVTCTHTADDGACAAANPCAVSTCSAAIGCVVDTPIPGPCDDGLFCNGADTCNAGTCSAHSGDPCSGQLECQDVCNEALGLCGAPFGTPCTQDGNVCTDNVCDGIGSCVTLNNAGPCDDGIFCNGNDVCTLGGCSFHLGTPCQLDGECRDFCDESAGACQSPFGDPCSDDANSCTDDFCDGAGICIHQNNAGPCEDGDFCTTGDVCAGGQCQASDATLFEFARVLIITKPGAADDQFVVKAVFPASVLAGDPGTGGMRLQMRDETGLAAYDSQMPPSAITTKISAASATYRFRDSKGLVAQATGMRSASVKHVTTKGEVRVKFRMKGVEVPGLLGRSQMSMSMLLGDAPSTGDCLSGIALSCVSKGSKLRCGD